MERKLVRHGPSTLMISLPKKWIEKNKLKSGSKMTIKDRGNIIELVPETVAKENKIFVHLVDAEERSLRNILGNCYKAGFDEINIKFNNSSVLPLISKHIDLMIGFEIVKESKNSCVAKQITPIEEGQFELLRKKIFFLIIEMFNIILNDMKSKKFENLALIEDVNNRIRRFADFCRRVLVKCEKFEPSFHSHYLLISQLHYSNGVLLDIYKTMSKTKISEALISIMKYFKKAFDTLYDAIFKKDIQKIHIYNNLCSKALKLINSLLEKSSGNLNFTLCELSKLERTLYLLGAPASGVIALEKAK